MKPSHKYVLTPSDVNVLSVSRSVTNLPVAQVGAEAKIAPQAMKQSLTRLEGQGLVVLADDGTVIRLTDAGARVQQLVQPTKKHQASLLGRVTTGSRHILSKFGLGDVEPQVFLIPDAEEGVLRMSSEQITDALDEVIARQP